MSLVSIFQLKSVARSFDFSAKTAIPMKDIVLWEDAPPVSEAKEIIEHGIPSSQSLILKPVCEFNKTENAAFENRQKSQGKAWGG